MTKKQKWRASLERRIAPLREETEQNINIPFSELQRMVVLLVEYVLMCDDASKPPKSPKSAPSDGNRGGGRKLGKPGTLRRYIRERAFSLAVNKNSGYETKAYWQEVAELYGCRSTVSPLLTRMVRSGELRYNAADHTYAITPALYQQMLAEVQDPPPPRAK